MKTQRHLLLAAVIFFVITISVYYAKGEKEGSYIEVVQGTEIVTYGKYEDVVEIDCNPMNLLPEQMLQFDTDFAYACMYKVMHLKNHINHIQSEIDFEMEQWVAMRKVYEDTGFKAAPPDKESPESLRRFKMVQEQF